MPRSAKPRDIEQANHGRDRKPARRSTQPDILFAGWANFAMPASKQADFQAWTEGEMAWPTFADLVAQSFRFTVSYDHEEELYLCSVMCRDPKSVNCGMMTSQRSPDALRAILKATYAVYELMPDDWAALASSRDSDW